MVRSNQFVLFQMFIKRKQHIANLQCSLRTFDLLSRVLGFKYNLPKVKPLARDLSFAKKTSCSLLVRFVEDSGFKLLVAWQGLASTCQVKKYLKSLVYSELEMVRSFKIHHQPQYQPIVYDLCRFGNILEQRIVKVVSIYVYYHPKP